MILQSTAFMGLAYKWPLWTCNTKLSCAGMLVKINLSIDNKQILRHNLSQTYV